MKKLPVIILAVVLAAVLAFVLISVCFKDSGYTVYCCDESGNPVEGVKVQLCNDKTCRVEETDSKGKAEFSTVDAGVWEVHIAKVPDGYVKPEEEIMTSKDASEIQFTVFSDAGAADASTVQTKTAAVTSEYSSLDDIDFADYKLVVVNYWEPWCCFCLEEMPDFEKLYQEYKDQGLLIVGLYSETDGFEEAIESVGGISYPLIKYDTPENIPGGGGVPVTVFYDSEGNILSPEVEEIYAFYRMYLQNMIDSFDVANYADEDPEELTAHVENLKTDPAAFEAEVQAWAADDLKYTDVFCGFAYGENWRNRIESRLNA